MNYLQLVNKVLVKLRESTVGTINENDYSSLIGEFVNEAKHEVESSYNWMTLRKAVPVSVLQDIFEYNLGIETSSVLMRDIDDPRLPMAFCVTPGFSRQIYQLPLEYVSKWRILNENTITDSVPQHFGLQADQGEWSILLLERPTTALDYTFFFKVPQDELVMASDTLNVPWRPVVALAVMYALNERGEEIGEPGNIAEQRYRNDLANAISLEAVQNNEQLVMRPE